MVATRLAMQDNITQTTAFLKKKKKETDTKKVGDQFFTFCFFLSKIKNKHDG